jgi:hypothetical protein
LRVSRVLILSIIISPFIGSETFINIENYTTHKNTCQGVSDHWVLKPVKILSGICKTHPA